MSDIKFNCPECGTRLEVPAAGAGMTVACPNCSQQVVIPAGSAPQPSATRRGRLLLLSLAGAAIILAVLAGVRFLAVRKHGSAESSPRLLQSYFAAKGRQSKALAEKLKLNVAPEVSAYFEAGAKGDWQRVTNLFANLCQRSRQFDPLVRTPVWQPVIETIMARDIFAAWGAKYAATFGRAIVESIPPGSIYFGGTDQGRGLVTALCKSHADGQPFFTLTQNGLSDGTYVQYLRAMYGGAVHIPTDDECKKALEDYYADFQRRVEHDRLLPSEPKQARPGEDVRMENGRVVVKGAYVSIVAINGLLAKAIFDKNPDREFFVEESFPLEWMFPHLTPHGLVMKINREPLDAISPEGVKKDQEFWSREVAARIGGWLREDTPPSDVCTFAEKVYVKQDFSSFKGDPEFFAKRDGQRVYYARAAYSKLRCSIGGIYVSRVQTSKDPGERQRMQRAADFAFRQAFALAPDNPEAVFRYVALLRSQGRLDNALLVARTARKCDPANAQLEGLVSRLENEQKKPGAGSTH
jgi:DNA-directed RNA polymerase subunit RPC12/RpoP